MDMVGTVLRCWVALVLLAGAAHADEQIGEILNVTPEAGVRFGAGDWLRIDPATRTRMTIPGRGEIETDPRGELELRFTDRRFERTLAWRKIVLGPASLLVSHESRDPETARTRVALTLNKGSLHYVGEGGTEITVPNGAVFFTTSTEFIVRYDPASATAEVIGVAGHVAATNRHVGGDVSVGPGERSLVARGRRPTSPQRLSDEEMTRYVRSFELVGGGKVASQTAGHPLLSGAAVADVGRAPVVSATAPPAHEGAHEREEIFEQPRSVIESSGLIIRF